MSQADVSVLFELQVARDNFRRGLDAMRADFENFRQQAMGQSIEIPVRIRDEATGQLRTLMGQLQSEAAGGITIPVNVSGAGGGGSFGGGVPIVTSGSPILETPGLGRSALKNQLTLLESAALGITSRGAEVPPGIAAEIEGLRSQLGRNGGAATARRAMPIIEEGLLTAEQRADMLGELEMGSMPPGGGFGTAESMMAGAAGAGGASGGGVRGGMRMMRSMALMYVAIRGAEGAYTAVSDQFSLAGISNGSIDERGEIQRARSVLSTYKAENSLFFGLPGMIRNMGEALLPTSNGPRTFGGIEEEFQDALTADELVDRKLKFQRARSQANIELLNPGGSLYSQGVRASANRESARLAGGTFSNAQDEINAEYDKQINAAKERAEKLRKLHADEQLVTQEYNSLVQSADIVKAGREAALGRQETAFQRQTNALAAAGRGDFLLASQLNRADRDSAILDRFGDNSLARERIAALDAIDQRQDRHRASDIRSSTNEARMRFGGDVFGAMRSQLIRERIAAQQADPYSTVAIQQHYAELIGESQYNIGHEQATAVMGADMAATLAGVDSPFERQRQALMNPESSINIRIAAAMHQNNTPLASALTNQRDSEVAAINRSESRSALRNFQHADEIRLRMHGRTQLADAMKLVHKAQNELAPYMHPKGHDNAGDSEMRASIKADIAAQAEFLLQSTSDPKARNALIALQRGNFEVPVSFDKDGKPIIPSGGSGGGGPGGGDTARKWDEIADKILKAEHVLVLDDH